MAVYIQRRGDGYLETIDEFDTRKEAGKMIWEYRMSDPYAEYYLSSRPCKEWTQAERDDDTTRGVDEEMSLNL